MAAISARRIARLEAAIDPRFNCQAGRRGEYCSPTKHQEMGGGVMRNRLAQSASIAAALLFTTTVCATAETYEVTSLVPGSAFHGVHGLAVDQGGRLFAGSVAGAALYE